MNQALSYFAREWFIEELALLQFSEPLTFLWYDNQPQTVLLEGKLTVKYADLFRNLY